MFSIFKRKSSARKVPSVAIYTYEIQKIITDMFPTPTHQWDAKTFGEHVSKARTRQRVVTLADNSRVGMDSRTILAWLEKATPEQRFMFRDIIDNALERWTTLTCEQRLRYHSLMYDLLVSIGTNAVVDPRHLNLDDYTASVHHIIAGVSPTNPRAKAIKAMADGILNDHPSYKLRWQRVMLMLSEIGNQSDPMKSAELYDQLQRRVEAHKTAYEGLSDNSISFEVIRDSIENI
jgi:hypothetical protein